MSTQSVLTPPPPPVSQGAHEAPQPLKLSYRNSLSKDLPSGLVVFLVALPLCLGISLASGAPLLSGLIAGIVGGVVVSWLSGSQLSVSGPAAGLTTIVLGGISSMGSYQGFLVAVVLAGAIQALMGALKAGVIGMYFPTSVIRGMLAAIGLILILKQIPHFLGGDSDFFEDLNFFQSDGLNTFSEIGRAMEQLQPGALVIGVVSLLILLVWERPFIRRNRVLQLVPGALIVVLVAIALNLAFDALQPGWRVANTHLVRLPQIRSLQDVAGLLTFPDWSVLSSSKVYVLALTIAIVASLESLLSVEAVDKLDPHKRRTPPNRELMAQGAGNFISGMLGGLPLTAVIVRSSANINAGGQTRLSAFSHGLLLLMAVLFLSQVLNLIPLSALAAVLLTVGYKLTKPALYRTQWKLGWAQFLPFIVTVVVILFTDLLKGVGVGLVLAMFYILKANAESAFFFHHEPSFQPHTVHLKLSEHVSFLNKAAIATTLDRIKAGTHLILDGTDSVAIDYDVLEAIENFRQSAAERGVELELRNIPQVEALGH
ncbi:SulP family inorganic anion transporter [Hymenobacter busanensis]|uniref:SulP family inorganic anion transporter n=1 Tax=Hymenobacter busanensis TaxID=2607656 RepID=A0A7L4ZUU8_9BACT|nr:SulP family inorganic anion transporter [Hymenobacter busanensis]KAA9339267.1 SulP family inorganic anion transporter [Hymenobacter busanensis]QHJ06971.1 SulP family inorganic anion transporter [Hymenobacter busanensis]